jgi:hypothetical protein
MSNNDIVKEKGMSFSTDYEAYSNRKKNRRTETQLARGGIHSGAEIYQLKQ